jgi:hypothetical protein
MPVAPPEINAILPASLPGIVRSSFLSETFGYCRTASGATESGKRSGVLLPKTRPGKILRAKKIVDGESFNMPATIDDPAILDEIGAALMTCRGGGFRRP